jgi:phage RecT family recombinase
MLRECSADSLMNSILQACVGGFRIGGPFPEAHLVPFKNKGVLEAQLIVDYRGVIQALCRGGAVTKVQPRSVYAGDFFKLHYGTSERIEHEPALNPADQGNLIGVYVLFTLADGSVKFDYMSVPEIDASRAGSKARDAKAWTDHYEQMAWKTVIKRGSKTLPVSYETRRSLGAEDTDPADVERAEKPVQVSVRDTQPAQQEDAPLPESADPEREKHIRELFSMQDDYAEEYAAVMDGGPSVSEMQTGDLRACVLAIRAKVCATAEEAGQA